MVDSTTHASQQTVIATTNPQVDIEELKRVCQSVEESRLEAQAQIYKIRRDFYTGLQEKEQLIKSAKAQLEENGELRRRSRYLEVMTHESPSWVAWRRIKVWKVNT